MGINCNPGDYEAAYLLNNNIPGKNDGQGVDSAGDIVHDCRRVQAELGGKFSTWTGVMRRGGDAPGK